MRCAICFESPPEAPATLPHLAYYEPGGALECVLPPGSPVCGHHLVAVEIRPGCLSEPVRAGAYCATAARFSASHRPAASAPRERESVVRQIVCLLCDEESGPGEEVPLAGR